jgi:adenine-specific DNA-methyltransferase
MHKITRNDPEAQSANLVSQNVEQLKTLFPEAFTEGKVDFEVLKQLLGGVVDVREEKYGLNWHGKRRARQIALTPSLGTLRPCPEESVDWDTTQNLMIEGDNLEVLKLLQKSYAGKVKMIYIDPPYNTGKDFVYPDNFQDNIKNYLELTGQTDSEGRKISTNSEASGRFHTDWLNMVFPRIKLARNFLRNDGFFVASIDDSELPKLREVLDETFGPENFVAVLVYDRNRKNDAKLFSIGHEYMLVYAKDKGYLAELKTLLRAPKEGVEDIREEFDRLRKIHSDDWSAVSKGIREFTSAFQEDDPRLPLARYTKVDEKGPYRTDGDAGWPGGGGPTYEVLHPVTGLPCRMPPGGWRFPTPERFNEEVARGRIVFGPDGSTIPGVRRNLFEQDEQVMRSVTFSYAQKASQDFAKIFGDQKVFDNPKSFIDLERLICYLTSDDDIVMDFFAGSGTTGHAVMLANQRQSECRRFICVQLPEMILPENEAARNALNLGLKTIADISIERLRRASRSIALENPMFSGDLGFRVFKLDSSNINAWDPDRDNIQKSLLASVEHVKVDRSEQDILFEVLLKLGLELTVPMEARTIAGKQVHSIGVGSLLVCLDPRIARDDVEALAHGIVAWHKELAPAGETQIVFRDSAFVDDVAKSNLTAILQQFGLKNVRSL